MLTCLTLNETRRNSAVKAMHASESDVAYKSPTQPMKTGESLKPGESVLVDFRVAQERTKPRPFFTNTSSLRAYEKKKEKKEKVL